MYSNESRDLKPTAFFRVWDAAYQRFSFTDLRPNDDTVFERWTGFFDKEGRPIYEHDILSLRFDWIVGWVAALVERESRQGYSCKVIQPDGTLFELGSHYFTNAYVAGNLYQHSHKLVPASKQFPRPADYIEPRWWSSKIFQAIPTTKLN